MLNGGVPSLLKLRNLYEINSFYMVWIITLQYTYDINIKVLSIQEKLEGEKCHKRQKIAKAVGQFEFNMLKN